MTMQMKDGPNLGDLFYDHFVGFLGNPSSRSVFQQDAKSVPVQVLEFDGVFSGCKTFCSFGASAYATVLGENAEVVLPCDRGWNYCGELLANSLFYLIQHRMKIGTGIAISGLGKVAPVFAETFQKTALYLTEPIGFPEGFSVVK